MYWGGAFLILSFSCFKNNNSFAFFSSCHLFFLTFFPFFLNLQFDSYTQIKREKEREILISLDLAVCSNL